MDITTLTVIVLAGILLESFVSERAHGRTERTRKVTDRLASSGDWE